MVFHTYQRSFQPWLVISSSSMWLSSPTTSSSCIPPNLRRHSFSVSRISSSEARSSRDRCTHPAAASHLFFASFPSSESHSQSCESDSREDGPPQRTADPNFSSCIPRSASSRLHLCKCSSTTTTPVWAPCPSPLTLQWCCSQSTQASLCRH